MCNVLVVPQVTSGWRTVAIETKAEDDKIVKSAFLLASFSVNRKQHKTVKKASIIREESFWNICICGELWNDACRSDSRGGG